MPGRPFVGAGFGSPCRLERSLTIHPLRVRSVIVHHVAVPLRKAIAHASHARTSSDNVVVRVELHGGHVGYGEGVPRTYVTGESIESVFDMLGRVDAGAILGTGTPDDFEAVVRSLRDWTLPEIADDPRGMAGNAARCALEMALLDAGSRHFDRSWGEAVAIAAPPGVETLGRPRGVRYSGAITAESNRKEVVSAIKMRVYGFRQVKVKVGVDGQDDPRRLERLRKILGRRMDIRLDANEAWPADDLPARVAPLLPFRPSALEQPVAHAEVGRLAELRPLVRVPVMLDESLCGYPDGDRAVERKLADIFNVRLSKCGGLFPTLALMGLAGRSGLGVQLGCHPGETGLLSAAGRHLATRVRGIRYLEGSYDRHVLARNLITEDVTFRYGGRARPIAGPGLGVTVDPDALSALSVRVEEVFRD